MNCILSRNHFRDLPKKVYVVCVVCSMVRNAGQLPQPFWLGAVHGSGSCAVASSSARP